MSCISENDQDVVRQMREENKDLLQKMPTYDTVYNILRFAQSTDYDLQAASLQLHRHLIRRMRLDLDTFVENVQESILTQQYIPIGLIGMSGKDNTFVMIEAAAKIDLKGILEATTATEFTHQRFLLLEKLWRRMNDVENNGDAAQSGVQYIIDLDGLELSTSLYNMITEQYRQLWGMISENYPEFIVNFFVINAPYFMSTLWSLLQSWIPARTAAKIKVLGGIEEYAPVLLEYIDADHLPKHWGGTMVDSTGDGMCREYIRIPTQPIPEELYWQPDGKRRPRVDQLEEVYIVAGGLTVLTFKIEKVPQENFYACVSSFCTRDYRLVFYRSDDEFCAPNIMELIYPMQGFPPMPTVDTLRLRLSSTGYYHIVALNTAAWLRSLTVHMKVRFENASGEKIKAKRIQDNSMVQELLLQYYTE